MFNVQCSNHHHGSGPNTDETDKLDAFMVNIYPNGRAYLGFGPPLASKMPVLGLVVDGVHECLNMK